MNLEERSKKYEEMKQSWSQIIFEAENGSPTKKKAVEEGIVGDENENADVVAKILDRHHRIGFVFVNG